MDEPAAATRSFLTWVRNENSISGDENATAPSALDWIRAMLFWLNDVDTAATRANFATDQSDSCIKKVEVLE
jgi:hypothetical protein